MGSRGTVVVNNKFFGKNHSLDGGDTTDKEADATA